MVARQPNFLEFKTVTSTGKNAGQSAFRDRKKQANNIYITLKNETVLYELDKDGYAVRLQSADFDYLKKSRESFPIPRFWRTP